MLLALLSVLLLAQHLGSEGISPVPPKRPRRWRPLFFALGAENANSVEPRDVAPLPDLFKAMAPLTLASHSPESVHVRTPVTSSALGPADSLTLSRGMGDAQAAAR
jgi:hypothetical protein